MDQLDAVAVSILRAANIIEGTMSTLSREDLRDLFPGPENFFRRKAVWHSCHAELDEEPCLEPMGSPASTNESPLPQTSTPVKGCPPEYKTPEKVVKLSFPEYVLHTDSELEQVRKQFFELAKKGCESDFQMSKDLRCRLIRNTMTSMIAILRAKGDKDSDRYPSKPVVTAMAKRIVQYYPMLQDRGSKKTLWVTVYAQLNKRLQNVRSPQKTSPGGRHSKKRRVGQGSNTEESSGSTIILDQSSDGSSIPGSGSKETANRSTNIDSTDTDSRASMAKHYRTLQAWYNKKKNPDYESVSQLLDLEYAARRAFIDSDATREDNKHEKILEAYPCFRDIRHAMGELRRLLDKDNSHSIDEMKERWQDFCQKVQFYGVWKKMLKPPLGMDKEDPNSYLKKRPLPCPVLIVSSSSCLLAIGDAPIATFPKQDIAVGAIYLMAYYYAFHLTYPKCVATLLSVIQTEILLDKIHDKDLTPSYKKGMAEWKAFLGQ
ncbi:hypothetical protein KUCAC02_001961 [Chaenocephalus aceratus]|uniref:Uncharacterized protein n=1 Tax=Chaenocephalus aceratus TaxID=36190 RepID=A0ACB9XU40_CHAAC|nr:hypothetical protein KUCAC02_001961 [Chaenocephalus aceratus]